MTHHPAPGAVAFRVIRDGADVVLTLELCGDAPVDRSEFVDLFWEEPTEEIQGAVFTPGSGYVNDPQLATR